jgi:hypothetical protein
MKLIGSFWTKALIIGMGSLVVACGSEQPAKEEMKEDARVEIEDMTETAPTIDFVMPSPLQVASIFKRAGLHYEESLANSPENVSNYSSKLSKALNFGIYAADLSYCVLNNKSQESINYMKVVKQLSDDIGMTGVFGSDDIFSSFERNVGNEDSMIFILASVQENLDDHLESTEEQYMSVVFFAGGWTEGMYIGAKVAEKGNHNISVRLVEQMAILENLISALEQYPHKSNELDNIIADFKEIENMYQNFESIKSQENDISFDQIKLTDEELKTVTEKVSALRTKIVNG